MKIMHIIAPVSFGGGESLLVNLINEKVIGIDESIVLLYKSEKFIFKLKEIRARYYVIKDKELGDNITKKDIIKDLFLLFYDVFKINKIIKNGQYKVLHLHGFSASIVGYIIKKINNSIKIIYTHHGIKQKSKFKIINNIQSKIYNSFDELTSVSQFSVDTLNKNFNLKKKFIKIHNCIAKDFFYDYKSFQKKKNNIYKFLYIARFIKSKNHLDIVLALKKLNDELSLNIEVVLAGNGPELKKIKAIVKEKELENNFVFLGSVNYSEIKDLINSCDYCIFPSIHEAFGLGAVECMSQGLPVLAYDIPIMNEIIKGNGILVCKNELAFGLKKIIEIEFKKSEIIDYTKQFSPSKIKEQYSLLYKGLI
ncbi:glycosyltransferase family 4 protein [Poseidonibacter lekithochrous]|uniref:glycosyltransferase family 4 protein n=1 Tax=Poseidonibacter lekithochrous TaxID=1904463 RepID=UPI000D37371E|nr:glycosyltransferase family 4 protein [Poseidonibacter lekithochrous]